MEIKNRKILAYILIILGLLAIGYMAFTLISKVKDIEKGGNIIQPNTPQNTAMQPKDDGEKDVDKQQTIVINTSFDGYESVLVYDLHEDIEEVIIDYVGVEEFDKQLVAFMKSNNLLIDTADSGVLWINTAKSQSTLTVDLDIDVYTFELMFDNMQESRIRVDIAQNEVVFEVK